jgi:hypothetical protein
MTETIGELGGGQHMELKRPSAEEWMRIERAQAELAEAELIHIVLTRYIRSVVHQILIGVGRPPAWTQPVEGFRRG